MLLHSYHKKPENNLAPSARSATRQGIVVLRAARLIDGTGNQPISNAVVVVTDEKITAVSAASGFRIPTGAKIVDLGDVTLLPVLLMPILTS